MIPVHEAVEIALKEAQVLTPELVPLGDVGGYVLAEDIYSDIDMPPFDKSSMDGYAVRANDVELVPATLENVGFIPAGIYPDFEVGPGQAAQIMTGAPLPAGSDSVQMVEKTEKVGEEKVRILEAVTVGKHVARRSEVMTASSMICPRGTYVSPALAGVLATVGQHEVRVNKRPQVGILVTGNELASGYCRCSPLSCSWAFQWRLYLPGPMRSRLKASNAPMNHRAKLPKTQATRSWISLPGPRSLFCRSVT